MERYITWYREGHLSSIGRCFDIGSTIGQALRDFEENGDPYSGGTHERSAGNGSIMRLAPVPLFYCNSFKEAVGKSGESSKTTHQTQVCIDACRYFGALIWGAVNGANKEDLLSERFSPISGYWEENSLTEQIDEIASGSFKRKEPPEIKGSGYVVKSLEAALWAFYKTTSFKDGCLLAVNLGDDADTTGAVYGQLAGALYGQAGIPEEWKAKLALRETIESYANQLYEIAPTQGA